MMTDLDGSARQALSLPLRRTRLPLGEVILPYLRRIDKAQWYSNFGVLVKEFEARLAEHFGFEANRVTTVANGTFGLIGALQAQQVEAGSLCALPSFTFAASPAAVVGAGLRPYFLDVDRNTWALEPNLVEAALGNAPGLVGAVMPVSPFGGPLDVVGWDAFAARTGIKVVLDAAWAFDGLRPLQSPAVVSLHATKVLGVGEGGLVVAQNATLISRLRQLSNFGFSEARTSEWPGGNYKMSEYSAAIGLAALDAWPATRAATLDVAAIYRRALDGLPGVKLMPGFGNSAGAVCAVELDEPIGPRVVPSMRAQGIESRLWWGKPCHLHPAYANCPFAALPNTEWLAPRVLCLPFYPALTEDDVYRVVAAFKAALASA